MSVFCEADNLAYAYDGHRGLDVHSLRIARGEITAVVGPNGAGKTTLLEILALLRRPQRGSLRLWGRPACPMMRRDIVMAANPPFLFHGSVAWNVEFGLRARGLPRAERRGRTAEALDDFGLVELSRREAGRLSTGQRQRVNLARAFVLRPQGLLLDEPLANLDALLLPRLLQLLADMRREGKTIVHTALGANALAGVTDDVVELEPHDVPGGLGDR